MGKPRTGHVQKRGLQSWRIRYVDNNGTRQQETIRGDRENAERELAIRLGEVAKGLPVSSKANTVLFEELAADVLLDYKQNEFSSIDDIDARFRLHLLPVFGKRRAVSITTSQIRRYVDRRQEEKAAVGTINRELEALRHVFNLALKDRKIFVKPHVPMLREDNVRTGFFTREDVQRLTAQLSEPLAAMVWVGFLTGFRLGDIRGLLWRNIDFDRGEIRLDPGSDKNRAGRVFPMTRELYAILDSMRPARAVDQVTSRADNLSGAVRLVHSTNMPTLTPLNYVFGEVGDFRKAWKRAMFAAALPCVVAPIKIRGHLQRNKDGTPKVKVIRAKLTFHDLRRSFARELSNRGIREAAIMKLGGWKTRSVFDRYNIVSDADLRDAIDKLDDHANSG